MLKRLLTNLANQEHVSDLEDEEDRIRWTTGTMFSGELLSGMRTRNLTERT